MLLKVIDAKWMDHIDDMDQLRQGIGIQAYGQRDPKVEYKMLGYDMFDAMTKSISEDTVRTLFRVRLEQKVGKRAGGQGDRNQQGRKCCAGSEEADRKEGFTPNDPCPCGSGKKYKQCCGRKA